MLFSLICFSTMVLQGQSSTICNCTCTVCMYEYIPIYIWFIHYCIKCKANYRNVSKVNKVLQKRNTNTK